MRHDLISWGFPRFRLSARGQKQGIAGNISSVYGRRDALTLSSPMRGVGEESGTRATRPPRGIRNDSQCQRAAPNLLSASVDVKVDVSATATIYVTEQATPD